MSPLKIPAVEGRGLLPGRGHHQCYLLDGKGWRTSCNDGRCRCLHQTKLRISSAQRVDFKLGTSFVNGFSHGSLSSYSVVESMLCLQLTIIADVFIAYV